MSPMGRTLLYSPILHFQLNGKQQKLYLLSLTNDKDNRDNCVAFRACRHRSRCRIYCGNRGTETEEDLLLQEKSLTWAEK